MNAGPVMLTSCLCGARRPRVGRRNDGSSGRGQQRGRNVVRPGNHRAAHADAAGLRRDPSDDHHGRTDCGRQGRRPAALRAAEPVTHADQSRPGRAGARRFPDRDPAPRLLRARGQRSGHARDLRVARGPGRHRGAQRGSHARCGDLRRPHAQAVVCPARVGPAAAGRHRLQRRRPGVPPCDLAGVGQLAASPGHLQPRRPGALRVGLVVAAVGSYRVRAARARLDHGGVAAGDRVRAERESRAHVRRSAAAFEKAVRARRS